MRTPRNLSGLLYDGIMPLAVLQPLDAWPGGKNIAAATTSSSMPDPGDGVADLVDHLRFLHGRSRLAR